MCGFYSIAFIEFILARKTLSNYTNLFLQMTIKRMTKQSISILKMNVVEEASLEFRLKKVDETRNYLLDEIKVD